jgi:hypothetical protein
MSTPNNNQNPIAIWQGIWGNLFSQINDKIMQKDYLAAWEATRLLITQLPPDCLQDIAENEKKIKQILNIKIQVYTLIEKEKVRAHLINQKMPDALLELLSVIKTALYVHNWINKDFSVKPRSGNAEIRCPE